VTSPVRIPRLSDLAIGALQIYIFDPAHDETPFPGSLDGATLTVTDCDASCALLCDASNSADADGAEGQVMARALYRMQDRVRRAFAA